jgi:hypothetical protein
MYPVAIKTGVNDPISSSPKTFNLLQNYPNPFNPETKITYSIPNSDYVVLKIFNILGQEVRTIVSKFQLAGTYSIRFSAENLTSGIYFYKLQVGSQFVDIKKMTVIR